MTHIFDKDLNTKVYGEFSELSSQDTVDHLRLNPLPSVKAVIDRHHAPLVILKPLVETQNALELLDFFPGGKVLWLYRHYRDVAASSLRHFSRDTGVNDIRPIVDDDQRDWRAEHVPPRIREIVLRHFAESMNPHDGAALFWFVRNSFFFDLELDRHPRVHMCRYEDLVRDPAAVIKGIYAFIGRDFPGERLAAGIYSSAVGRGNRVELSAGVEQLCRDMLSDLDRAYRAQVERAA